MARRLTEEAREARRKKALGPIKYKPFPEIVDNEHDGSWTIREETYQPAINPTLQQMFVPLGDTERDRAIRNHEMGHVRFSPPSLDGIPRDINMLAVQAFEDYRINTLLQHSGIETPPIMSDADRAEAAKVCVKSPFKMACLFAAAEQWRDPTNHSDSDAARMYHDIREQIEQEYNRDIADPITTGLADTWYQRRTEALARVYGQVQDITGRIHTEGYQRVQDQVERRVKRHKVADRDTYEKLHDLREKYRRELLAEAYPFEVTLAAAAVLQTLIDPDAGDPAKDEPTPGGGEANPGDGLAERLGENASEFLKEELRKAEERKKAVAAAGTVPDSRHIPQGPGESEPDWQNSKTPELTDLQAKWGEMRMKRFSMPLKLPAMLRGKKWKATDEGTIPLAPYRAVIDGKVFGRKRLRRRGPASVLIDVSGSMSLSPQDILRIMQLMPGSLIADYCGSGGIGELRILAKNGWRARDEDISNRIGNNNLVDGPALVWLAKQPAPRYWVSDGGVTGLEGHTHNLIQDCVKLQRRFNIRRLPNIEACKKFFEQDQRA